MTHPPDETLQTVSEQVTNLSPFWHETYRCFSVVKCVVVLLHAEECKWPAAVQIGIVRIQLDSMCVVEHCFNVFLFLHTLVAFLFAFLWLRTISTQFQSTINLQSTVTYSNRQCTMCVNRTKKKKKFICQCKKRVNSGRLQIGRENNDTGKKIKRVNYRGGRKEANSKFQRIVRSVKLHFLNTRRKFVTN